MKALIFITLLAACGLLVADIYIHKQTQYAIDAGLLESAPSLKKDAKVAVDALKELTQSAFQNGKDFMDEVTTPTPEVAPKPALSLTQRETPPPTIERKEPNLEGSPATPPSEAESKTLSFDEKLKQIRERARQDSNS